MSRNSKRTLLAFLYDQLNLSVPHAALEKLHKFFDDSRAHGTFTFHFKEGELVGWSTFNQNYKTETGGDTDE